jgi:endonuclease/exonuclease/phosphatase family metal-dependent hydrolase
MRLGTWNLLHGISLESGQVESDLLGDQAATLDCDLLAIQEVDERQPRSDGRSQTEDVAKAIGAEYFRFLPSLIGTPGERWEPHSGIPEEALSNSPQYGIGLISRRPVLRWHELRLKSARSGMPLLMPTERGVRLTYVKDEPRIALAAELGSMTVASVHLSFVPGRNVRQLRQVMRWLNTLPGPRILMGDFNLPGGIPRRVTGWHDLAKAATYPAWKPKVQFDHILSDYKFPVKSAETPALKISDHRPLIITLP